VYYDVRFVRLSIWHSGRRQNVTAIDSTICRRPYYACVFCANGDVNSTGGRTGSCAGRSDILRCTCDNNNWRYQFFFRTTLRFQRNFIASTHWGRHSRLFRSCLRLSPDRLSWTVWKCILRRSYGSWDSVPRTFRHSTCLAWHP